MCACAWLLVFDNFVTLRNVVCQAPLSMGFSRQEYWSGLPFPSPQNLPKPEIEPTSPALTGGFFTTVLPGPAPHPGGALPPSPATSPPVL